MHTCDMETEAQSLVFQLRGSLAKWLILKLEMKFTIRCIPLAKQASREFIDATDFA